MIQCTSRRNALTSRLSTTSLILFTNQGPFQSIISHAKLNSTNPQLYHPLASLNCVFPPFSASLVPSILEQDHLLLHISPWSEYSPRYLVLATSQSCQL